MKVGDRVKKSPMWKYDTAEGTVIAIKGDYTVVKWDNINGDWFYTPAQCEKITILSQENSGNKV